MALDIKKFVARFVEEARDHLTRIGNGLHALEQHPADREQLNSIFRSAHTIKGSSRMLKLMTISDTAHQLEEVLSALREGKLDYHATLGSVLYRGTDALSALVDLVAAGEPLPPVDQNLCQVLAQAALGISPSVSPVVTAEPATLSPSDSAPPTPAADVRLKTSDTVRIKMDKLDELIKLMGEVVSSHARSRQRLSEVEHLDQRNTRRDEHAVALHRFAQRLRDDVLAQELLMNELHSKVLLMRMLPLAVVFDPIGRMVRELSAGIGKEVECVISGADIELDRQLIDKLADPILHLLRNAVDHGIEVPAARLAAGKPARGRITLAAHQEGGQVVIDISDNGGGIPLAAIRDKAVRKGLMSLEAVTALSEAEVIDLIFLPGFSTSPILTDISGRGVGMDVVKRCIVDDLRGVVSVASQPSKGTAFTLRLPLSLAMMRVLLIEAGGIPFGFTAQYVVELLRVPAQQVLRVAERRAVIIRNEFVPIAYLPELLDLPAGAARQTAVTQSELLLLVVRVRGEKLALVIDDLLDERDMVIKPLPAHLHSLNTTSGMVTTGKNELVNILHVPELLAKARRAQSVAQTSDATTDAAAAWHILVVDDSLNTREIEKDVLEAQGYRVTLAEDGQDGLRKAQQEQFDAVLTDIEMPNMDGFTLTERLRQEPRYHATPIIIITSREKPADKQRGVEVGADAYIVKGDFDQTNLVDTLRNLLG